MPIFLVERYVEPSRVAELGERLRAIAPAHGVEWLGSILLAGEDACLCLFRADSHADVMGANELADVAFDRVVDASLLGRLELLRDGLADRDDTGRGRLLG